MPIVMEDPAVAIEIASRVLSSGNRTVFIDVKENAHGRFVSIRERRSGQSSRICVELTDVPRLSNALSELFKECYE